MNATLSALPEVGRQSQPENHVNRAGAPSYRRSLQERVLGVLSTGTLGDTYYASREELAKEAVDVITEAREACPHFLARALVWAREEGMMKTLPVLGLVILSAGGRYKDLFEQAFPRVVKTPDDLRFFVATALSGKIHGRKGLGGMTVEPVRKFLTTMSEYHAVKYGSANSTDVRLADIIRLAHPKPASPQVAERLGWLIRGTKAFGENQALNPQIRAFESLKRAATEDEQLTLIREGRLPFEVVVPSLKKTTLSIWSELLRQAPYMNLLRNLVTFTRHQVFQSEENVRYAVAKLTDPNAVQRSRVLPFRFFNAWRMYCASEGHDSRIADALRTALDLSFSTMPPFGSRRVALGPDVSGSMSGGFTSKESTTRYIDIAGIFTGALLKRIEGRALVLPFDGAVRTGEFSSRDDIMVTTEKLARYQGGSTAVGAPIEYLLDRKIEVDVFIGITDNVDWAHGQGYETSAAFLPLWHSYKREIAPQAQAFLVTIAPYGDAVAPTGTKGVHFIYGWSDRVVNYIALKLQTGESQVEAVERMELAVR
jgi:60 kDa SS-A/Ro ribonucleoprotein